jgi:hypothetical protein
VVQTDIHLRKSGQTNAISLQVEEGQDILWCGLVLNRSEVFPEDEWLMAPLKDGLRDDGVMMWQVLMLLESVLTKGGFQYLRIRAETMCEKFLQGAATMCEKFLQGADLKMLLAIVSMGILREDVKRKVSGLVNRRAEQLYVDSVTAMMLNEGESALIQEVCLSPQVAFRVRTRSLIQGMAHYSH